VRGSLHEGVEGAWLALGGAFASPTRRNWKMPGTTPASAAPAIPGLEELLDGEQKR